MFALITSFCLALSGCAQHGSFSTLGGKSSGEYFRESKYGTKASPRVGVSADKVAQANYVKLGKPYKVHGKWYYPRKKYTNYTQIGKASWYGAAFQGRLTANGEVYDMNSLSAAHPTMPLPSYVRVTNLSNGSSIIVRVNDRGPYVSSRIIDLSKRAAELLDYKDNGLAQVKIQYIGLAPLHTNDNSYLIASYRAGGYNQNRTMVAKKDLSEHKDNMLAMLPEFGPVLQFKHL